MRRQVARTVVGAGCLVMSATLTAVAVPLALASPGSITSKATVSSAFTATKTVSRVNLVNGADVAVETRKVTVTASVTKDLRDRQSVAVSWTGAHPTAGILADPHAETAAQQEYPMVLLQCRGIDSASAPAAKQITPETCWTGTPGQRYTSAYSPVFPPWRVDRYATPAQRTHNAGAPTARPGSCGSEPPAERWVPFVAANGTTFFGGPGGCDGIPPEASLLDSTTDLPSNSTYGVTNLDGSGSVRFDVRGNVNNGSLGCSATVACAIVAIPIMGISCDVAAAAEPAADQPTGQDAVDAATSCTKAGHFKPGSLLPFPSGDNDQTVSGILWWSASNWRNRITIPITMAPDNSACNTGGRASADIYGSELLVEATSSWLPVFCLSATSVPVRHVQTGEPQARNLLSTSSIEAAFTSRARDGGYGRRVVHAPVAVTGFAISYAIDNAKGDPVTSLKLTPRLLAKLLTSSYPSIPDIKSAYPALANNPLDMSLDPEFQALNPGITKGVAASLAASNLYSLSSDSDVVYALTSYIDADPEARAFLDGKADPWGMVVNPNYLKIALPVNSWPLLDTFEPTKLYDTGTNPCLKDAPVPYLPLVASPTQRLATISLALQYSIQQSQVVCVQPYPGLPVGEKLVALGRQSSRFRFMIGVTSLGDADRYGLNTAALQTNVVTGSGTAFSSSAGRTFVAPSTASLKAAAALVTTTSSSIDWQLPYSSFTSDSRAASAYPGTMLVYADIPTTGLSAHDAAGFASFLDYAAKGGQVPGQALGQLPDGFLPMTAANDLGALADYTTRSAAAVRAQKGAVPPLVAPSPAHTSAPPTSSVPSTGGTATAPTGGSTAPAPSSSASATPTSSASATPVNALPVAAKTQLVAVGASGLALPVLLAVSALAALGAGIVLLVGREPR